MFIRTYVPVVTSGFSGSDGFASKAATAASSAVWAASTASWDSFASRAAFAAVSFSVRAAQDASV